MRYENKFVFDASLYNVIYYKIMQSSFFFSEIYHERRVNSIYLDTTEFSNYYDNVMGVQNRTKHRIRWYGHDSHVDHPVLEYKIKQGEIGYKKHMSLPAFVLDKSFDYDDYLMSIKEHIKLKDDKKQLMYNEIAVEIPTLFNSYIRRYFLSNDGKYRITLDENLVYNSIGRRYGDNFQFDDSRIVLELKYKKEDVKRAIYVAQELGCRVSKNSKYVTGVNGIYFNDFL